MNLNDLVIPSARGARGRPFGGDYSPQWWLEQEPIDYRYQPVFRDMLESVCSFIRLHPIIVGCVAWVTHPAVLKELSQCDAVSLVVQKETYLRTDLSRDWHSLHEDYGRLRFPYSLNDFPDLAGVSEPGAALTAPIAPVRCLGAIGTGRRHAIMHHKFLVGCIPLPGQIGEGEDMARPGSPSAALIERGYHFAPYAVWTGSANLTLTAMRSLDNAVMIWNKQVALAYHREWLEVLARSEPLDWTNAEPAPTWRIEA